MEKMHVLVANEPRAYREAITDVLRELRPHIEFNAVEPDGLDGEVERLRPHLVVCSRITGVLQALWAWIMLYPDGENRAEIFTAGELATVDNVEFSDLLSFIDRVELLLAGKSERLGYSRGVKEGPRTVGGADAYAGLRRVCGSGHRKR